MKTIKTQNQYSAGNDIIINITTEANTVENLKLENERLKHDKALLIKYIKICMNIIKQLKHL